MPEASRVSRQNRKFSIACPINYQSPNLLCHRHLFQFNWQPVAGDNEVSRLAPLGVYFSDTILADNDWIIVSSVQSHWASTVDPYNRARTRSSMVSRTISQPHSSFKAGRLCGVKISSAGLTRAS